MAKWEDRRALWLGLATMVWKRLRPSGGGPAALPCPANLTPGVSVVIPSREGRHLLEQNLPGVAADLAASGLAGEIIVVDNGSSDGTGEYLRRCHPDVRIEEQKEPLSFAQAANRGALLARHPRLCLLNNDMAVSPGFFAALDRAFAEDPTLFCASAQIFFPAGVRREETGRTALRRADQLTPDDYPVFCDEPLAGEDGSPVLYGSGGCSLYDLPKFLELGGLDEFYHPAYVEDLDLGYRAWLRGWPSVYVAGAAVLHRHRATTSRFYAAAELDRLLEVNHARFLLRGVRSPGIFRDYYPHAIARLRRVAPDVLPRLTGAGEVFHAAARAPVQSHLTEREIVGLTSGAVRVFPGRAAASGRRVLVSAAAAKPSRDWLAQLAASAPVHYLAYTRPLATPEPWLLELCRTIILVDGPAGDAAYRPALKYAQRRYSIEETIWVEKGLV